MPPRINLPPLTRILLLAIISLSALNAALRTRKWSTQRQFSPPGPFSQNYLSSPEWAIPYLVCIPTKSLRYPWTFLTGALIENNILSLAVSGTVVWFGGRYLERAWGTMEFGKFILFVTVLPNAITFLLFALWQGVLPDIIPRFPTPLNGMVALGAGFLVSLKQLVPEHTVSLFKGLIRMRIKHFPSVFVLANILSGPLLGTYTAMWLSLFGFVNSWVYLRFFRISEISSAATGGQTVTMRGDASDTFAFIAFFPDFVHPFIAPFCDSVYITLVQMRVCTPFSDEAIEVGNETAASRSESGLPSIMNPNAGEGGSGGMGGSGGGGRRAEAERRRAIALKALDQRLNAAAASRIVSAPVTSVQAILSGDQSDGTSGAGDLGEPVKEGRD